MRYFVYKTADGNFAGTLATNGEPHAKGYAEITRDEYLDYNGGIDIQKENQSIEDYKPSPFQERLNIIESAIAELAYGGE